MSRRLPPRRRRFGQTLAVSLLCAATLGGCLTQQVKPTPSQAVLQTRARQGATAAACAVGDLSSVSPVEVGFGFEETQLGDASRQKLEIAAAWLKCNPGVRVVIRPAADNHGTAAKQREIAQARAKTVLDQLRALGATEAVVQTLAMGAPDPVSGPHLLIEARGRGW